MEVESTSSSREDNITSEICTQPASIYSLPNEVLIIILKNLSIYDKMSFGMTCKRIHNVFNSTPILHQDKVVKFNKENSYAFFTLFNAERNEDLCYTILPNIECQYHDFNETFWAKYGKFVTSLKIGYYNKSDDQLLLRIFSYCSNIEEFSIYLHATDVKVLNTFSTLQFEKVKKIKTTFISDIAFNNFIKNAPKLKCFITSFDAYLRNNSVMENQELPARKRMKIDKGDNENIPLQVEVNNEKLTYRNFMHILPMSKITSFCKTDYDFEPRYIIHSFRRPWVDERVFTCADIKNICELKQNGFKLEELCIKYERKDEENTNGFQILTNTYGDCLKYLKLTKLNAGLFMPDAQKLTNLKTLILPEDIVIKDKFAGLKCLKNLETLHFGALEFFMNEEPTAVAILFDVLQELQNIRRLCIKGAVLPKFDTYLKNKSVGLIELHIEFCKRIQLKKMLLALYENHKLLRKLTLITKKTVITDDYICHGEIKTRSSKSNPKYRDGISVFKDLTHLALANTIITDKGIMQEFKWNQLKSLKIRRTKSITDAALLSISKSCPALVELDISGICPFITDEGLKHLCNLTRLRKIDLGGKITAVGINYLIESSCPLTTCEINCNEIFKNDKQLAEKFYKKLNRIF